MKIIEPNVEILRPVPMPEAIEAIYRIITICGGTSYLGGKEPTPEYTRKFISERIKEHHDSVLEHAVMTVRFTVDRGVSHELVRHRLAAITQESQRYVNYSKEKFGKEITVIKPFFLTEHTPQYDAWYNSCMQAEASYFKMLECGCKPEEARTVLPNSTKTTVTMTCNFREWRHILNLRAAGTTGKPHPQMLEVMIPLLERARELMPELFNDIHVKQ